MRHLQIKRGRRVDMLRMLKRISLRHVGKIRRKPHAKFLNRMIKYKSAERQKRVAVYAYPMHRKAYLKRL